MRSCAVWRADAAALACVRIRYSYASRGPIQNFHALRAFIDTCRDACGGFLVAAAPSTSADARRARSTRDLPWMFEWPWTFATLLAVQTGRPGTCDRERTGETARRPAHRVRRVKSCNSIRASPAPASREAGRRSQMVCCRLLCSQSRFSAKLGVLGCLASVCAR